APHLVTKTVLHGEPSESRCAPLRNCKITPSMSSDRNAQVSLTSEPDRSMGGPMTRTPSIVGLNLRRLRLARGLSQEALAQLGGWSRVYIARIETGAVQSPTAKTLQKLAE